jgi:hypothetical protein
MAKKRRDSKTDEVRIWSVSLRDLSRYMSRWLRAVAGGAILHVQPRGSADALLISRWPIPDEEMAAAREACRSGFMMGMRATDLCPIEKKARPKQGLLSERVARSLDLAMGQHAEELLRTTSPTNRIQIALNLTEIKQVIAHAESIPPGPGLVGIGDKFFKRPIEARARSKRGATD